VIRGIDNTRPTPEWMQRRLQRAGLRPISPIVDVTNFVMLELGQPLHAYDAGGVRGALGARRARAGETVQLRFSDRETRLAGGELMIVDDGGPVGLAGVMGGARTAVTTATTQVALESAWFVPAAVAGRARAMASPEAANASSAARTRQASIARSSATTLIIGSHAARRRRGGG
jgi:phenylalanyl-tRNA synthetase beta chain